MKKLLSFILAIIIMGAGAYYQHTKSPTNSTSTSSYEKVIYIPSDRYPETAAHVKEAEARGESSICTIDRKDADAHRKQSLAGIETKAGYDRDEFPMAMCAEGGQGADVKLVHSPDNRGEGSWVSHQLSGLADGTKVLIKVK